MARLSVGVEVLRPCRHKWAKELIRHQGSGGWDGGLTFKTYTLLYLGILGQPKPSPEMVFPKPYKP